ncbi:MAG: glycoside hydrolase family 70 protein [Streptococcus salivarius]
MLLRTFKSIEQKIQAEKSTQWLRETISAFVKTQPQWNKETENYSKGGGEDHLPRWCPSLCE